VWKATTAEARKEAGNRGAQLTMQLLKRIRTWVRPDIRQAIDGVGLFFAITLDGIVKRNRDFDQYRWWYPIYRAVQPYLN
jgi:hypothetical protein